MKVAQYKSRSSSTSTSPSHHAASVSNTQAPSERTNPTSSPPPPSTPPTTPEPTLLPTKTKRKNHRGGKKTKTKTKRKAKKAAPALERNLDDQRLEKIDGPYTQVAIDEPCLEGKIVIELNDVLEAWVQQGDVLDVEESIAVPASCGDDEDVDVSEGCFSGDEIVAEAFAVEEEPVASRIHEVAAEEGKIEGAPPTPPPTPPTSAAEMTSKPAATGEGAANLPDEPVAEECASAAEQNIIPDTVPNVNTYNNIIISQETEVMLVEKVERAVSIMEGGGDVVVAGDIVSRSVVGDEGAAVVVAAPVPDDNEVTFNNRAAVDGISAGAPVIEEDNVAVDETQKATGASLLEPVMPAAELDAVAAETAITAERPAPTKSLDSTPSPPEQETTIFEADTRSPELPVSLPQSGPPKAFPTTPSPRRAATKRYYKVASTPNAGLGMFASRKIPRGTRILSESPLMLVEDAAMSYRAILPIYASLPAFQKTQLLSLSGAEDTTEREGFAHALSERDKHTPPSRRIPLDYEEQAAVQMIFGTNTFSVGEGRSAIFMEASRMNHSCLPNVYHTWNENLGRLTVHALRDIKAGEEILTTYISALLTREERANEQHLGNYGFVCACPACNPKSEFFRESGVRRALAVRVEGMLAPYFAVGDLAVAFKYGVGGLKGVEEGLRLAQLRVRVLMEEGVVNMDLVKCVHEAGQLALLCGDGKEAMKCANVALALTRTCCGDDSSHMEALRQQLRDLERFMRLR